MGQLVFQAALGGQVNLVGPNTASTFNLNVPAASDTLVGEATTNTLTNKTLASPAITGVATFAAGSAAAPAITTTGDTNTGIFFPAADTIAFTEGGAEAMRIDSSGNVGIGTASPSSPLNVVSASSSLAIAINGRSSDGLGAMYFYANNGSTQYATITTSATEFRFSSVPAAAVQTFYTNGGERMRIDSSGNLGIGTASPSSFGKLAVTASSGVIGNFESTQAATNANLLNLNATQTNASAGIRLQVNSGTTAQARIQCNGDSSIVFQNTSSDTERMRIDPSGDLLMGATSARTSQAKIELTSAANTALSFYMFKDTQVEMAMGFKSSTDSNFYIGSGSTSVGTYGVYLTNTGNSWNAVSDERMKTILEPIENASEKVSSLRAVIGYYNNDESQIRRPFLIAQDVQQVLPEAVNVQDIETGTLGMSYTDTIPLLVAAIKEQQTLITALTTKITALENK